MTNSPYTRYRGDDLHGWHAIVKPTWIQLDAICVRAPYAPINTVADGLDMIGEVRRLLSG
ncbi:hypothetical protein DMH04_26885 [Kibdelosporangium aridum]|uniref:Uncharacterized protein n=1 Tax=Kibdelosporangium aridum TaxID=2030 RepID=A0A428Z5B6_KIBAR|nr:hypothetical protein [Kibdelosporangium aridum]RSM81971.1 hypothetical protein DMH04_26885 [Kibdelosporangium aridum]